MKKHLSTSSTLVLLMLLSGTMLQAQSLQSAPRLVVNIAIDQLRSDYIEQFAPLYGQDGFRRLFEQGMVFDQGSYSFSPVDRSSAIASISTGTTPYYNNISGNAWLDRDKNMRKVASVDDIKFLTSANRLATSTIGDEMKMATKGSSLVYGIAEERDAAVLSAGHAANGAFWLDKYKDKWTTSFYYPNSAVKWINSYNNVYSAKSNMLNDALSALAVECVKSNVLGMDEATDYLAVTLSAKQRETKSMEQVYVGLDRSLGSMISSIENKVGKNNVLFVLTGTGYYDEAEQIDYSKYNIPTGSFYINRTANLLNMYLGAIYGHGQYVDACFGNQIYLNRSLIEKRNISLSDIRSRSRDFLVQNSGVTAVHDSPYNPSVSGDLIIEVTPGWKLINETSGEQYISRLSAVAFPIIFYGAHVKAQRVETPAMVERIAATIAKTIHIRAPNACKALPLY
jgi:hypothetical protein